MAFVLQFLVIISLVCCLVNAAITCMDNDNKPVDWFIVYKLPVKNEVNKQWPFPPHLYMDSNNPIFQLSKQSLNETSQSVAYTLQQAYSNHESSDIGYIFYNDEKPVAAGGAYTESFGHTKGVTIFGNNSALWLVHSVPKFPPPTNTSYMYPDNGVYYGQHMLCISIGSPDDISAIGNQLLYNEPWIYDYNLPQSLSTRFPEMLKVIAHVKPSKRSNVALLHSTKSTIFISFAKSASFKNDLYSVMVAPSLQCNLKTETWQNGPKGDNLPSACNQTYTVETVLNIGSKQFNISYSDHKDHSKFAVCQTGGYICIGDINRQVHQMVRGGGTVCFYNAQVQKQYLSLITEVEECKVRNMNQ